RPPPPSRFPYTTLFRSGLAQGIWPIFQCIVFQTEHAGQLYVLSAGDWFRVNLEFKDRVYEDVGRLPYLTGLPDADPGTNEDAYKDRKSTRLNSSHQIIS